MTTTSAVEEFKISDMTKQGTKMSTASSQGKVFDGLGFYLLDNKKLQKVSIVLNAKTLLLKSDEKTVQSIRIKDILGATTNKPDAEKNKFSLQPDQAYLNTDLFVLKIHLLMRPPKKDEESNVVEARKYQKIFLYHTEQETPIKWKNLILHAANNPDFNALIQTHNINDLPNFKRRILVFVNTKSGPSKPYEKWQYCRKLLLRAGLDFHEIMLDESSKLFEFLDQSTTDELLKYAAIVSVSGDGTPHDIINRFYSRPDHDQLLKIPLMLIPGGTCNALTQNITANSGEDSSLESCCYIISKGRSIKSDVTVYERDDGLKIYSFLSLTWGVPANIDLESKTLESLGGVRYHIYGVWETLRLKKYKAKFSWSENVKRPPSFGEDIKGEDWKTVDGNNDKLILLKQKDEFNFFMIHSMQWAGLGCEAIPMSDLQDGISYYITIKGDEISRKTLLK